LYSCTQHIHTSQLSPCCPLRRTLSRLVGRPRALPKAYPVRLASTPGRRCPVVLSIPVPTFCQRLHQLSLLPIPSPFTRPRLPSLRIFLPLRHNNISCCPSAVSGSRNRVYLVILSDRGGFALCSTLCRWFTSLLFPESYLCNR